MEKSSTENGFIIDLGNIDSNSQLVLELSSVMEQPDVKGKNICLKLGDLDLKQSQLLSIKALIESMDANLAFISTKSEQTEASAISLGLNMSKYLKEDEVKEIASDSEIKEETENFNNDADFSTKVETDITTESEVEQKADSISESVITTKDDIADVYMEESTQEISEVIPKEHFETNFEALALNEGLVHPEDVSKYILLDTEDVLPEGTEEHSENTEELPTLYLHQNLRSGQTVTYKGNILLMGDAHPGSEIIADGDITVWGILSGIAHAGANGNVCAKVRALKLNAIQLRIAGMYARRNDTLNVPYVQKTDEFTPEEAQIEEKRIVIYKKLRRG